MGKPIYIKIEKKLDFELDKVWQTVALGFGDVSNYNPQIKNSYFESEIKFGVGTKRHCDFPKTGYIKEEITDWEEKKSFGLQFIESSVPMGHLKSKFIFKEADNQTILTQELWFRLRAPFGWLSGLMKGKMKQTLENGLNGLEEYLRK